MSVKASVVVIYDQFQLVTVTLCNCPLTRRGWDSARKTVFLLCPSQIPVNHKFLLNLALYITSYEDPQFGGSEAREKLEKSLISKLDIRMGILVLIYILNCKIPALMVDWMTIILKTSTGTTPRTPCPLDISTLPTYYTSLCLSSAARLHGFEEDLGLEDSQFASILSILYVGYLLMQTPSWA